MITIGNITLRIESPEFIGNVINKACDMAAQYRCRVDFEFRGIYVSVEPGDQPQRIFDDYSTRYDVIAGKKKKTYKYMHKKTVQGDK